MMRRRMLLLAGLTATLTRADTRQDLIDLFASMASALSESNPGVFLRAFDPAMPGYERFAADINALAAQNALSCSIEMNAQKGDDRAQEVQLDWLLEISGAGQNHLLVRRQSVVKLRLERQKLKWRIVALDPLSLFAPPGAEAGQPK
jgi:hypothetical protein